MGRVIIQRNWISLPMEIYSVFLVFSLPGFFECLNFNFSFVHGT